MVSPVLLFSCDHSPSNNPDKGTKTQIPDSSKKRTGTITAKKTDSTLLMNMSAEILRSVKTRDYEKLASFIHPLEGVLFSPYAYIDTTGYRKIFKNELVLLAKQNKRVDWNTSWEEDKPELMTIDQYFKKFVYDVDFLNAQSRSLNKFHSQGTERNNITEVYPGCDVVEFFFPGFEKQYEGLDFRGLRLVFKIYNNTPYIVAIVHDQWTP